MRIVLQPGTRARVAFLLLGLGTIFGAPTIPSASGLVGGSGPWKCKEYCELEAGQSCPSASACTYGIGFCHEVVHEFSGICEANGPLLECTTVAENEGCVVIYRNACLPDDVVCNSQIDECGSKYSCQ